MRLVPLSLFMYDQVEVKKFFRYAAMRYHLLYEIGDSSGLYLRKHLATLTELTGVTRQTVLNDLKYFHKKGWIVLTKEYIQLPKLESTNAKMWKLFMRNIEGIRTNEYPMMYFTLIVKEALFRNHFFTQVYKELRSDNVKDARSRKRLMKLVTNGTTEVGETHGIFCSLRSSRKVFGKSLTTVHRYVRQMEKGRVLKVKREYQELGEVGKLGRLCDELRNRVFVENQIVYRRKCNSYAFSK